MIQIVLTPEQISLINSTEGPVVLVDGQGKTVGQVGAPQFAPSRFSPERLAAAEARIGKEGPGISTAELLGKLERLKPSSST